MTSCARTLIAFAVAGTCAGQAAVTQSTPPEATPINPASAPASAPVGIQSLKVIVASVTGMAQVRASPQDKWQRAEVGMELGVGAEVRTGTRSQIVCTIPPDQTITLDRLGTISILEALRSNNKTTSDFIMKYGRTDYEIESAGREHDATIRTPNATLSVRGTAFTAYDQPPFEPQVETRRGLVDFRHAKRTMSVGRGSRARGNQGPVETALESTVVDPAAAKARTASENVVIATEISRGAVLGFDPLVQIQTSFGGRGPQTDAQLMASLPGRLNFVIRWDQPNTDLNLAVLHAPGDPLSLLGVFEPSEVLYPGFGLDTTLSGGRIVVDNRGGPRGGQEVGFYNNVNPGIYGLQALHVSGDAATVSFNAFLDGKAQPLFATLLDENGEPVPRPNGVGFVTEFNTTIKRRVQPQDLEVATALIPFPPELLPLVPTPAAEPGRVTPQAREKADVQKARKASRATAAEKAAMKVKTDVPAGKDRTPKPTGRAKAKK